MVRKLCRMQLLNTYNADSRSAEIVRLDAPLTDSIDKKLMPNATMSRFTPPADAVCEVGLSHLSFRLSPSQCGSVVHAQEGVMQGIVIHPFSKDCWIRNCGMHHIFDMTFSVSA